jgi:hypothetical protein
VARNEPSGYAWSENVVEQVLEDGVWVELAVVAAGRVLGQVLVHLVAQKEADIQPQAAMFDEAAVADQVFQAANQHQLKAHDWGQGGLACVVVEGLWLLVEKVLVEQLGEAVVEILRRYARRKMEAQHDFIDELLVALHNPKIPLASHLLLQQPLHLQGALRLVAYY